MISSPPLKLVLWALTAVSLILHHGRSARCDTKAPTVQQIQVGFGEPPKFAVEVKNNCPMCPVIDIHLKCGNFSQAVVDPRQFKVLSYDDCIVNGGLPLPPLQKLSFNYSHSKFLLTLKDWHFQCE